MSTAVVVQTIFDAILAQMATTLTGYSRMRRVYDPKENDARTAKHSYGLRHLPSNEVSGVMGSYTMDQGFEMVLCRISGDRASDTQTQADINEMHDKVDSIYRAVVNTHLGLGTVVLGVYGLNVGEPEILDNGAALLRAQMTVKYRQSLS